MISQNQNEIAGSGIAKRFSEKQWLFLIITLAVVLRLSSAFYQGNEVVALPGIWDQLSYDGLAQRIVAGYGFSFAEGHWPMTGAGEPTAHWSYLYTLYLAAVYAIFGYQPLVARIIQALIVGVFQTWFTWRIGRRIFGTSVGFLAAAISAVYVYFFYYGGSLLTESFYFVGILWTLDVALRIAGSARDSLEKDHNRTISWWLWLELGLAIGVTVLLRQVFLLFVPILFLWILWNLGRRPDQRLSDDLACLWPALRGLAFTMLVIVLLILPWTIRNYRAFDSVIPLNTNAGFAFYWGNHRIHGAQFVPLLPISYADLIPAELLSLNEGQLDQALLREALKIIAADPKRFLLLSVSRMPEYFKFWPSTESSMVSNLSRVGSFTLFLPFMLYGLWRSFRLVRDPVYSGQRADVVLLYLFMIVYTTVHLASWTLIRYRLPVDAILIIFAALGINNVVNKILVRG